MSDEFEKTSIQESLPVTPLSIPPEDRSEILEDEFTIEDDHRDDFARFARENETNNKNLMQKLLDLRAFFLRPQDTSVNKLQIEPSVDDGHNRDFIIFKRQQAELLEGKQYDLRQFLRTVAEGGMRKLFSSTLNKKI